MGVMATGDNGLVRVRSSVKSSVVEEKALQGGGRLRCNKGGLHDGRLDIRKVKVGCKVNTVTRTARERVSLSPTSHRSVTMRS